MFLAEYGRPRERCSMRLSCHHHPGISSPAKHARRGGGKAHLVEELVRLGGRVVYFNGGRTKSAEEFEIYPQKIGREKAANWSSGVRGAQVYARGLVRHPDHATLVLNGWQSVRPRWFHAAGAKTSSGRPGRAPGNARRVRDPTVTS